MQSRNELKVSKETLGFLDKYHQIVLELVEYTGFKGLKIDDQFTSSANFMMNCTQ